MIGLFFARENDVKDKRFTLLFLTSQSLRFGISYPYSKTQRLVKNATDPGSWSHFLLNMLKVSGKWNGVEEGSNQDEVS